MGVFGYVWTTFNPIIPDHQKERCNSMTVIDRETFKVDPVWHALFSVIKRNHKVAEHTCQTLYENRFTKDFCEEARHFLMLPANGDLAPIYLHYDVASWYHKEERAAVKIESIAVYDNFMEYETARMRGLHSGRKADIPNIN